MKRPRRLDIWRERGVYRARFSYDLDLVNFFRRLPSGDRAFDRDAKTWNFHEKHLREAVLTARQLAFDEVFIWPAGQAPPPRAKKKKEPKAPQVPETSGTAWDIVNFFQLLPHEAARAAYLKAATMLHPDKGGSNEAMRELNALWDRIEREWYGA
jgi:hypothetical protein